MIFDCSEVMAHVAEGLSINLGILEGILTTLGYGSNTLTIKVASRYLNARLGLFVTTGSSLIFLIIVTAFQWFSHSGHESVNLAGIVFFTLSGIFTSWLGRLTMFRAVVRIGPALTGTYQIANPILTLIVAAIALGEIPSAHSTAGLILSILGLLTISVPSQWLQRKPPSVPPPASRRMGLATLRGIGSSGHFIAFVSSVSYAVGAVFRKQAIMAWNDPIAGAMLSTAVGLILLLPQIPAMRPLMPENSPKVRRGLAIFILSGLFITVGQVSVLASMFYLPSAIATLFVSLQPLVIIPVSKFLLHTDENLDWRVTIGCLAVVAGMVAIAI